MELFFNDQKAIRVTAGLLNVMLAVIIVSAVILLLTYPYKKIMTGNVVIDVEVSLQNKNFNSIVKTPESNYLVLSQPKGTLSMTPQNIWVYLIAQSKYFFLMIAGLIVLFNARILLHKIKEEKTFDTDNSKIVRLIAVIVMILPIILAFRTYLLNQYIPDNIVINGFKIIKPDPSDLEPIIRGIIWGSLLMALAKVFSQGRKIKEENDLTV